MKFLDILLTRQSLREWVVGLGSNGRFLKKSQVLSIGLINRGFEVFEVAYYFGEFSLAFGVSAGAFGYGVFVYIFGPVDSGPASAPFAAVCYLS